MRFVVLSSAMLLFGVTPLGPSLPSVDDVFDDAPMAEPENLPAREHRHVLFVVWDGVRPDDLKRHMDRLPILSRLARSGVAWMDENMRVSGSNYVSMPGYAELLTGTAEHGCDNNECLGALRPTLFNDARFENEPCAAFSSWGPIARHFRAPVSCTLTTSFGREPASDDALSRMLKQNPSAYRSDKETNR
jgi:hypothetical protein